MKNARALPVLLLQSSYFLVLKSKNKSNKTKNRMTVNVWKEEGNIGRGVRHYKRTKIDTAAHTHWAPQFDLSALFLGLCRGRAAQRLKNCACILPFYQIVGTMGNHLRGDHLNRFWLIWTLIRLLVYWVTLYCDHYAQTELASGGFSGFSVGHSNDPVKVAINYSS